MIYWFLVNVPENERREFKTPGVPRSADPSTSYKKTSQIERFTTIFGGSQKYINTTSYLSRGHLAPDADFVFSSSQLATYFYVNVAPQFQAINGGNWVPVESMSRKLAEHYQTELLIYTGVFGILKLQDQKLYLEDDNMIEVPKWYWKVIINPGTRAGIVMITSNNPFATNIRKGYTFCCGVNEFKRMVNVLPTSLNIGSLLDCGVVTIG
jgi:DNA/RNA endonuclease G (NUC1)